VTILFDHSVPRPLRRFLPEHQVQTAKEMGWETVSNGELLRLAEATFEILITADQNLSNQQRLTGRKLAILVLPTNRWPDIRQHIDEVRAAIGQLGSCEFKALTWA
jgi:predicted nuclease of predicted toxin-antitoxin system